ncbi:MAG: STAS domain-containing protein [Candidatus Sumerlaeia bacterium]|nr:STAS domain-containing protein [Candidatus Sumerlaeia bacterium]
MDIPPPYRLAVDLPHLGADDATRIQAEALELIRGGVREVVIDLSTVRYAESTFFGSLIVIAHAARNVGATLTVSCAPGPIREVLRVSSLDRVLNVRDTAAPT